MSTQEGNASRGAQKLLSTTSSTSKLAEAWSGRRSLRAVLGAEASATDTGTDTGGEAAESVTPGVPWSARLLVVCTGNAARSVMAGFMLGYLAEVSGLGLRVATAGTHAVEGQPMGMRTRAALAGIEELSDLAVSQHRSRQLDASDLLRADLVVVMEADQVRYMRRHHPEAAARTATLRYLCKVLPPGPKALQARVAALGLAEAALGQDEDVADPAGHDVEVYAACASELWSLCQELVDRL